MLVGIIKGMDNETFRVHMNNPTFAMDRAKGMYGRRSQVLVND